MSRGGNLIRLLVSFRFVSVYSVAEFWYRSSNDRISFADVFHRDREILDKMERRYILSKINFGMCDKKLNLY
jgi:hypothetical protein